MIAFEQIVGDERGGGVQGGGAGLHGSGQHGGLAQVHQHLDEVVEVTGFPAQPGAV